MVKGEKNHRQKNRKPPDSFVLPGGSDLLARSPSSRAITGPSRQTYNDCPLLLLIMKIVNTSSGVVLRQVAPDFVLEGPLPVLPVDQR